MDENTSSCCGASLHGQHEEIVEWLPEREWFEKDGYTIKCRIRKDRNGDPITRVIVRCGQCGRPVPAP